MTRYIIVFMISLITHIQIHTFEQTTPTPSENRFSRLSSMLLAPLTRRSDTELISREQRLYAIEQALLNPAIIIPTSTMNSLLQRSITEGDQEIVELLLKHSAVTTQRKGLLHTALYWYMYALQCNPGCTVDAYDVLITLIQTGLDTAEQDDEGFTIFDRALFGWYDGCNQTICGNQSVVSMLREACREQKQLVPSSCIR